MAAMIPEQYVAELAEHFRAFDAWRSTPLAELAAEAQERGQTPFRFRCDLRRAAVSPSWFRDLKDDVPHVTDNALDTLVRRALKQIDGVPAWATSQPLKR